MDKQGYRIAVAGVGLGLVAFIFGAALVLRTGHHVSREYWTAGSAISGALLGLLAPSPSTPTHAKAVAATRAAAQASSHAAAADAAALTVTPASQAAARAHTVAAEASDAEATRNPTLVTGTVALVLLFVVFVVALVLGITENLTQLQSLAAAAGGAIIGLIAPSPTQTGAV